MLCSEYQHSALLFQLCKALATQFWILHEFISNKWTWSDSIPFAVMWLSVMVAKEIFPKQWGWTSVFRFHSSTPQQHRQREKELLNPAELSCLWPRIMVFQMKARSQRNKHSYSILQSSGLWHQRFGKLQSKHWVAQRHNVVT